MSIAERLKSKIVVDPATGCWVWQGALNSGYGILRIGSKRDGTRRIRKAHILSYEIFVGPITPGKEIDHKCRNRACINPDPEHLRLLTHQENMLCGHTIAAANAAKTHCPHGHEYTPGNTYVSSHNERHCRRCKSEREAARRRSRAPLIIAQARAKMLQTGPVVTKPKSVAAR